MIHKISSWNSSFNSAAASWTVKRCFVIVVQTLPETPGWGSCRCDVTAPLPPSAGPVHLQAERVHACGKGRKSGECGFEDTRRAARDRERKWSGCQLRVRVKTAAEKSPADISVPWVTRKPSWKVHHHNDTVSGAARGLVGVWCTVTRNIICIWAATKQPMQRPAAAW